MRKSIRGSFAVGLLLSASAGFGCGDSSSAGGAGGNGTSASSGGAGGMGGSPPVVTCVGMGGGTVGIEHVVVIVQENHSFDSYFGRYCTAATASNPTCTNGPSCCEAAPDKEPSGSAPIVLDDTTNGARDPNHTQKCEVGQIDGGKMDKFVTGVTDPSGCSDPGNFAIASDEVAKPYHDYAAQYAIGDRYFQPVAGQSSSNDMYLAVAKFAFLDNDEKPGTIGSSCDFTNMVAKYSNQETIASLLQKAGHTVGWYAQGYADMVAANGSCPSPPAACGLGLAIYPCVYDPTDVPFLYYSQHADDPKFVRDYGTLAEDLNSGHLPDVSYVKAIGFNSEHPGYEDKLSSGISFVTNLVDKVESSCYKDNTLILLTWDEGGGSYDHVSPPPVSAVDSQPYGTRIPIIAIGRFAKQDYVSHVVMEHSSIVKFLEFLFLDGKTGQLQARDAVVNNIGSLLDPAKTGLTIPDQ